MWFESIRLENGHFFRLSYHQQRMDSTIATCTGKGNSVRLEDVLRKTPYPHRGLFKCRVVYNHRAVVQVEFLSYRHHRPDWLCVVRNDSITYAYKFTDRSGLEKLKPARPGTDALIIRNGLVTDALYSNLLFYTGNRWLTPAQPLLRGTMRQVLLDAGEIEEEDIHEKDIRKFSLVKRINAMLQFDEPALPVARIIW